MNKVSKSQAPQSLYKRLGSNSRSASTSPNSPQRQRVRWYDNELGRSMYNAGVKVSGTVGTLSFAGGFFCAIIFASGEKKALLPLIIFGALLLTSCAVSCLSCEAGPDAIAD